MACKSIGVDLGYGFVKVTDGTTLYSFPSVVGFGKNLSYQSAFSNYQNFLDTMVLETEGKAFFVGEYAIRQSDIPSRSLDPNRVDDFNAYILFQAALGLFAEDRHQKFRIVTGLPINFFSGYKDQLVEKLKGRHNFQLSLRGKSEDLEIEVVDVHIAPQPLGTLYDRVLNEEGQIENEDLAARKVGVVDIGFKTADFLVADKMEFIERLCFSTNNGLSSAYRAVAAVLRREFRLDKRDYELDKILEAGQLKIAGSSQDISEIKNTAFANLAIKIKTEIESAWDYRDLDTILITGGGGQAIHEYLLPEFDNAILVDRAQYSNCLGFCKLAGSVFMEQQV